MLDVNLVQNGHGRHFEHVFLQQQLVCLFFVDNREGNVHDGRDTKRQTELFGDRKGTHGIEIGQHKPMNVPPKPGRSAKRSLNVRNRLSYRGHGFMVLGGVARVSQVQYLQPFFTILFSWVLLGEQITMVTIGAALFVVLWVAFGKQATIRGRFSVGSGGKEEKVIDT